ncbi:MULTISPECIES: RNA pseudouridine synthase [Pseudomonas]|uniref:Dual-specificity RNA pseudouridine synthase RluF n=1 Tax=Pseudomonas multiresinivorans TaxID=95301 RepID=A0A7Z3GRS5_9PSED|nr:MULTISPECIES: RNA pseudouridine synthase [Pseudomonas]OBY89207.1 RNA-binding protein [Pseudomonas sp. AU11447]QJP10246.1 RNA-binding protein [Pseudomonas multiresinivorans]
MSEAIRLSKRLAELLPCSRREAELYIEGGWVTVDGQRVEEPQFKVDAQRIELLPGASADPIPPVTILVHKPVGLGSGNGANSAQQLLTPDKRWAEDNLQQRLLRKHFGHQFNTTVLETDASGLLVYTQSRGVQRRLVDEADNIEHEYVVEVSGQIADNGLKRLCRGLVIDGRELPPLKVSWQSENRLRFAGKQFRPGQIGAMCRAVGLHALSIRRLRLGGVAMGKLPAGQWRFLQPGEKF